MPKKTAKAPSPVTAPKSAPPKPTKPAKPVKPPTRLSGLDAAAQVLAQAKEPLSSAELTRRVLKKGLWKTKGQTPAATLSAAMLREIQHKGRDARFRKAGRGLFAGKGAGS